jgi:predicted  nucleic acid-binding Zn-ribbon protein|mmetsp:Transcript_2875/g.4850  ORF Transcript_2875/g.4850 Transcript_2875/m.4850 type:complete len:758 (-) Transcript_2875:44-2317(-)
MRTSQEWGSTERDSRARFGDAAYSSVSFSNLAATLEARNFDNKDRDRSVRRQRSTKLLQGVFDQVPGKCTRCEENEDKLRDCKKKSLLEIEHLRQGLKKCTDQLSTYMSPNAYAAFYQGLQLDVRFISAIEEDEDDKSRSRSESSPSSPKASMAENRKLKDEILRLEDEIARLELKNNQLEEELKRLNPSVGGRRSSSHAKPAPRMEHNFAQTTEAWPKSSGLGKGRLDSDDEGGIGKKQLDNDSLQKEIKDLKKALERANDEMDLANMKLRKAERDIKALQDQLKSRPSGDNKELEELRRKLKKLQALYDKVVKASGLSPEELERLQNEVAEEMNDSDGEDGKKKKGKDGADGSSDAAADDGDDPKRPRKGQKKGGKAGAGGAFHLGGTGGRKGGEQGTLGPGGEAGNGGSDEFGERRHVETADACVGPGPGYPQDQEMPSYLKGSAPKPKPEEPLSKYKTVCSKQPRLQPSLSMMGEPSGSFGSMKSGALSSTLQRGGLGSTQQTNLSSTLNQADTLRTTQQQSGLISPLSQAEAFGHQPAITTEATLRPAELEATMASSAPSRTETLDATAAELQQRLLGGETPSTTKAAAPQRTRSLVKAEVSPKSSVGQGVGKQSGNILANTAPSPQVFANSSTWPGGGMRLLANPPPALVHSTSSPALGAPFKSKKGSYTPQAEPYILNIWEHHPHGHQTPEAMRRELISLGAVSPRNDAIKLGKASGKGAEKRRLVSTAPIDSQQSVQAKEKPIASAASA